MIESRDGISMWTKKSGLDLGGLSAKGPASASEDRKWVCDWLPICGDGGASRHPPATITIIIGVPLAISSGDRLSFEKKGWRNNLGSDRLKKNTAHINFWKSERATDTHAAILLEQCPPPNPATATTRRGRVPFAITKGSGLIPCREEFPHPGVGVEEDHPRVAAPPPLERLTDEPSESPRTIGLVIRYISCDRVDVYSVFVIGLKIFRDFYHAGKTDLTNKSA